MIANPLLAIVSAKSSRYKMSEITHLTTQNRILIRAIVTVLDAVTEKMWTSTVSIIALKLSQSTNAWLTSGRFI